MSKYVKLFNVVCKKEELLESTIDGETVLMSLANNEYYGFNEVASGIWGLIGEKIMVKTIVEKILEEYDIDSGICEREILEFLGTLAKQGLIEVYEV